MVVDALANPFPPGATESTVLGPFYVPGSPQRPYGASIAEKAAGRPRGSTAVCSTLSGGPIEAPSSTCGRTATTGSTPSRTRGARGPPPRQVHSRDDGSYAFRAVRPVPYPIPDDGPVGRMLAATGRHPWRPAHVHMIVRAPGHRTWRRTSSTARASTSAPMRCLPSSRRSFASSYRGGPTTRNARTESRGSGSRSRTRSCSCRPRSPASRSIPAGRRRVERFRRSRTRVQHTTAPRSLDLTRGSDASRPCRRLTTILPDADIVAALPAGAHGPAAVPARVVEATNDSAWRRAASRRPPATSRRRGRGRAAARRGRTTRGRYRRRGRGSGAASGCSARTRARPWSCGSCGRRGHLSGPARRS